jgi:hypothetical protein
MPCCWSEQTDNNVTATKYDMQFIPLLIQNIKEWVRTAKSSIDTSYCSVYKHTMQGKACTDSSKTPPLILNLGSGWKRVVNLTTTTLLPEHWISPRI